MRYSRQPQKRWQPPKPRFTKPRFTAAQIEANRKAFDAAPYTLRGNHGKGDIVTDGRTLYRVVTIGIRYHEDASDALYGAKPTPSTREWKATLLLRAALKDVYARGTHTPTSRGLHAGSPTADWPNAKTVLTWEDRRPDSLAQPETLYVLEGDVVAAIQPIYDDSPVQAWLVDPKLAAAVVAAAAVAPKPFWPQQVYLTDRAAERIKEREEVAKREALVREYIAGGHPEWGAVEYKVHATGAPHPGSLSEELRAELISAIQQRRAAWCEQHGIDVASLTLSADGMYVMLGAGTSEANLAYHESLKQTA